MLSQLSVKMSLEALQAAIRPTCYSAHTQVLIVRCRVDLMCEHRAFVETTASG